MTTYVVSRFVQIVGIVLFGASVVATPAKAQTGIYVGQVGMFATNFCPRGWLQADGRLLQIKQYNVLFSVMGTWYGGNGTTDFALPKMSVPIQDGHALTACVAVQGVFPER